MFLQKLHLENFRNFSSLDLDFHPKTGITILLGKNAQGKTNILESIHLLSFPRSFRAKSPKELVRFEQNYYTILADFVTDSQKELSLKIGYQMDPLRRSYQKNQVQISLNEYLTNFQSVIFTPEDIEIISGSPAIRRRLVDSLLSQISREYFQDLVAYTKLVKQRNALLKRIRDKLAQKNELEYWDNQLINLSDKIVKARQVYFDFISQNLQRVYTNISENHQENIQVHYNFSAKNRLEQGTNYKDALRSLLRDEYFQEVTRGHTLVGPHRDDFHFTLDSKAVAQFCSRGEKRTFMLALKIIELEFLKEQTQQNPVLLLDDVFSELDRSRRLKLLELTKDYQTFISTVEKKYFEDFTEEKLQIIIMNEI